MDQYFGLTERQTTIATEFRAGTASFLTLSYLLLVNPHIMSQAGVAHEDAVFATAVSASVSSFIVGFFGNLPFGCAPGLGLSAYLAFGLIQGGLCDLTEALSICWWSGVFVAFVALSGISSLLMKTVPVAIKLSIVVGMGLLIAMIGLVSVGIIVANPRTLVDLGPVGSDPVLQLTMAGILLLGTLLYHNVTGAILIGISVLTLTDWILQDRWPKSVFQVPQIPSMMDHWDPTVLWDTTQLPVLLPAMSCFVLICVFDISGVIFGLATLAGIPNNDKGEIPGSLAVFLASAVGTLIAAWTGSTPIIVCVETAAGVREGGRTGLTSVVIAIYFALSLFLAPLFAAVPEMATAPVLVMVGVLMMSEAGKIKWENMNDALPAFLTLLFMPLTYSITNGMLMGLLCSAGLYVTTGKMWEDIQTRWTNSNRLSNGTPNSENEPLTPAQTGLESYGGV